MFVEGEPVEGTKSTNQEYADQANRMINALAGLQGHASLWTKAILANQAHGSIKNKLC